MPFISIIIVSYNTRYMTLECIRSIIRETSDIHYEIIVLDNASTDGSVEAIRAEFCDQVRLIDLDENIGFAAGNNRIASLAKGRLFLLLNPDTVVLEHAINNIIEFYLLHPQKGIYGGRTLFADGSLNPSSCWSKQTLPSLIFQALGLTSIFRKSNIFNPEGMGGWDRLGERDVDIVSGCFLLIRSDLWRRLGGFNEKYFMYGEEADLCLRSRYLGAQPVVTSSATIIHYGGASERIKADKLVRLLRAKMLLIDDHFSPSIKRLGIFLLGLWPISRAFAHSILEKVGISVKVNLVWSEVVKRKNEWMVI